MCQHKRCHACLRDLYCSRCQSMYPITSRPGNAGCWIGAVRSDKVCPSKLWYRTCSVPIQPGSHAPSTLVTSFSSSTDHLPVYATIDLNNAVMSESHSAGLRLPDAISTNI